MPMPSPSPHPNIRFSFAARHLHSALAIAGYIAVCAAITLVATALMTDYTGKDISGEYQSR
jgi:hypothetical protein